MNKYEDDGFKNGVIVKQAGSLKEYQTVLAVGPAVRNIEVGDKVMINPSRYAKMKHNEGSLKNGIVADNPIIGYEFRTVTINDKECLYLQSQDIMYSFEGEEVEDKNDNKVSLIMPNNKILC